MKSRRDIKPWPERRESIAKAPRDLFVAMTSGFNIRICEALTDGSLRALLWSRLTKAERRRGEDFVKLLAPDAKTLATAGPCAWKSPNHAKALEVAEAVGEFVADVEQRHGVNIWVK